MFTPLVGTGFEVWSPPQRKTGTLEHEWAMGSTRPLRRSAKLRPGRYPLSPRILDTWTTRPQYAQTHAWGTLSWSTSLRLWVLSAPEGHEASKKNLAQRAKAVYCPAV